EGGGRDPHGLREGLHQSRDRLVRAPRRSRVDGRGEGRRQGPHGGQGLHHAGRRRGGVPFQRVSYRVPVVAPRPSHLVTMWLGRCLLEESAKTPGATCARNAIMSDSRGGGRVCHPSSSEVSTTRSRSSSPRRRGNTDAPWRRRSATS